MVGYMFVQDPENWPKLLEVPGVAGVVRGMDGRPLPVDIVDMLMVRSMEALAQEEFDRQVKRAQSIVRRKAKDNPRLKRLVAEFDKAGIMTLPVAAALAA